jgi:hypothetical protein
MAMMKSGGRLFDDSTYAVAVCNPDGTAIAGGEALAAPLQYYDGASAVDAQGTVARGLLVDPSATRLDGGVDDLATARVVHVIGGTDGSNFQAAKTSSAGVLQVDVLSGGGGGTQYTEGDTDASITGSAMLWEDGSDTLRSVSAAKPLPVNVVAGAAGGTQYTEADTDASITGTAILWEDTSDTLRAVSAAKPLPVSLDAAALAALETIQVGSIAAGDNNIGNVDIVTMPSVALDAGTLSALETISIGTALPAGTNNIGDVDVLSLPALPAGNNNIGDVDIASIAAGDNNIGNVDIVSHPALPAGTNNIGDVDVLTLPGVAGTVAHDAADSGNPVKIGGRARTADVTAVAQDDRVDTVATILGKQVVQNYALPGHFTDDDVTTLTNTTAADVIAAPGAGIRLYITEITVTNAHATVGTKVEIRDGTTVMRQVYAAAAGGGASITFPTPLRLTANTALTARNVTTGADVDVSASGYTAAE